MVTFTDVDWTTTEATAPTEEPVTTAEAKSHATIEIADDDTLIGDYIKAARLMVEGYTKRQLVTATHDLFLDQFPDVIYVPFPPLASVTTVKYTDTAGTQQTLSSASYQTDTDSEPGRISFAWGESWPAIRDEFNAVEIRFVAGYGAASAVPERFKQAIRILVAHWYEHRRPISELRIDDVKFTFDSLLMQDRCWDF